MEVEETTTTTTTNKREMRMVPVCATSPGTHQCHIKCLRGMLRFDNYVPLSCPLCRDPYLATLDQLFAQRSDDEQRRLEYFVKIQRSLEEAAAAEGAARQQHRQQHQRSRVNQQRQRADTQNPIVID
jgi:hypothetical protein